MKIVVWNEGVHEAKSAEIRKIYPDGIHGAIAQSIKKFLPENADISTITLADGPDALSDEILDNTDVLLWWGHVAHDEVSEELVDRIYRKVHAGMGLIALHSAHYSKIFKKLMGTSCSLLWRNVGEEERIWTVMPNHPIVEGISSPVIIPEQEMYGEFFDIPAPDELIFISSFSGGEVFRSGVTYKRGLGKIFYFSPGDERYPVYYQDEIAKIIANGILWAKPENSLERKDYPAENAPLNWYR